MISQTSLLSYGQLKNTKGKRGAVLKVIMENEPVCNQQIASLLGWEINRVTPRTHELREMMKVEEAGKMVYPPTGKTVMYWRTHETTR